MGSRAATRGGWQADLSTAWCVLGGATRSASLGGHACPRSAAIALVPGCRVRAACRPQHRINVEVAYRPWPWLTLALAGRHVSSQYLRGDEANTQPKLPG